MVPITLSINRCEEERLNKNSNRNAGGGRKAILEEHPDINDVFLLLVKEHTAGDPMDEQKKWTTLTCADIAKLLAEKDFKVSRNIVRRLLKKHGYVKRKAQKKICWRACKP